MLLYVHVKPNQRFDRLEQNGENWLVRLRAPAVDGKANEGLIEFLSEITGLAKSRILIRKGHTSRIKCIELDAMEETVLVALQDLPCSIGAAAIEYDKLIRRRVLRKHAADRALYEARLIVRRGDDADFHAPCPENMT